ncbi:hypothetical protein TWF225_008035 [Orbilia oligospora]|uniref:Uncharacterized protein n=1 Tax=Orbilia oligospora TaxID=2813651 RepID=A0A8H2HXG4_ORBOL|nr:hypothetical protein TWF225_008035 [Orbilia oligospora]KAF3239839.1 hypothetical protein TWF217_001162 [Orbilia oligospora]KAF3260092.1 hypothetical protein TWF128_003573 [Orbilia oligospora]KAF3280307.1 hypothetical protein TWF132_011865 [Orbilia oligospora]TGJ74883.1 hypothetical protein EYR41_001840 [Orbilia oligospora]
MPPDMIQETTTKNVTNLALENQGQDVPRSVYHETMVACAPSGHGFDNSVGSGSLAYQGNMENMSFEIDQRMEKMQLEASGSGYETRLEDPRARSGGFETGLKNPGLPAGLAGAGPKYETESAQGIRSGTISPSESTLSTATTYGGKSQDDEDDEFEFERMVFNYQKAGAYFGASDWAKAELYLSAVVTMLDTHPKFEAKLQGTDKFNIMSILVACQARQNKWNEVLNNIDVVAENAKVSTMLPEDLQCIIGTLENLRADAYVGLGDLETARLVCKKAVRMRRGDSKRLGESVSLMVSILGEMGTEYDVEAEFYKSLIPKKLDLPPKEAPLEGLKVPDLEAHPVGTENDTPIDTDAVFIEKSDIENCLKDESPLIAATSASTETSVLTTPPYSPGLKKAEEFREANMPDRYANYGSNAIGELSGEPSKLYGKDGSDVIEELSTESSNRLRMSGLLKHFGHKVVADPQGGKLFVPAQNVWSGKDAEALIPRAGLQAIMHRAITEEGHIEIVEALLKHSRKQVFSLSMDMSSQVRSSEHGNPLLYAVWYNNLEMVALLLKYGADINSMTSQAYTALHIAAGMRGKGTKMMELLIVCGAATAGPIVRQNVRGVSPLHLSLSKKQDINETDKLALLLKNGAEINAKDCYGETPLMRSTHTSTAPTTLFLLEAGANVQVVRSNGDSALHLAARYYNNPGNSRAHREDGKSKIGWLLKYKADKNLKNKEGMRPIDYVKGEAALKMLGGVLKPDWYRF